MAGRPTKLTKKLQQQIVRLLKTGATVTDVCQHVGLAKSTFYDWLERGEKSESEFAEFSDAVTRAQNNAKIVAIGTLRSAMSPYTQTATTTETFTETRLDREGQPYTYQRELTRKTVTLMAGDWHAAVEYLKRRFPDEWTDRVKVDDWRTQAITDIRAGIIPFEALAEAFDDSLAAELFAAAGVPIKRRA